MSYFLSTPNNVVFSFLSAIPCFCSFLPDITQDVEEEEERLFHLQPASKGCDRLAREFPVKLLRFGYETVQHNSDSIPMSTHHTGGACCRQTSNTGAEFCKPCACCRKLPSSRQLLSPVRRPTTGLMSHQMCGLSPQRYGRSEGQISQCRLCTRQLWATSILTEASPSGPH